ncbi:hypothetical protein STA3757_34980 [Stanieria sp. NIES-3757]|nr:hypothetical protein STA3757_34980 [Stanieria sp. NIES-3757]
MIHHVSLPALDPHHVANVLAEIWNGRAFPFPINHNSYVVFAQDSSQGTCLEIYPQGTEMTPGSGDDEIQYVHKTANTSFGATHLALSVPISEKAIKDIARREGWRAVRCDRGPGCFEVVEFWVENKILLELLTPEMVPQYVSFMQPDNWENFLVSH